MSEQTVGPLYAIHRRCDGRRLLIDLHGEIDVAAAPPGTDFLDDISDGPGAETDVVVDLRPVTFIDGSGLNALLRLGGRLSARRHTLAVVVTNPLHRRLLHLVGLGPGVTLHRFMPPSTGEVKGSVQREVRPAPLARQA